MRQPISSRALLQGQQPAAILKDPANLPSQPLACQLVGQARRTPDLLHAHGLHSIKRRVWSDYAWTPFASVPLPSWYAPLCKDAVSVAGTNLSARTFQPMMRLNF